MSYQRRKERTTSKLVVASLLFLDSAATGSTNTLLRWLPSTVVCYGLHYPDAEFLFCIASLVVPNIQHTIDGWSMTNWQYEEPVDPLCFLHKFDWSWLDLTRLHHLKGNLYSGLNLLYSMPIVCQQFAKAFFTILTLQFFSDIVRAVPVNQTWKALEPQRIKYLTSQLVCSKLWNYADDGDGIWSCSIV